MTKTLNYSYSHIWKVAWPILVSLIMEQLLGMTDTAFLGRVGEVELAASAIAGVYCMAIFITGFGFGVGSQIIIARRNGEGNYAETGNIFWHGVYFLICLAVLVIFLSELFSPWLLGLLIESPEISAAAMDYVRWRLVGLIFAFVTVMFRAFYIGTTQTATLTLNSIVMVLSNVVFNWILVFGKLGFPALGIAGAAIGSTLAELVSLIFFIVYTATMTDCTKYGLNKRIKFSWKKLRYILTVSIWTMIQNFFSVSTWFIFFMFVEHIGERALAISNLIRSISGFLWVFVSAFASTCSSLVSNLIGEGHTDSVPRLIRRVIKLAYIPVTILAVLFAIFPEHVLRIYTDMPDLISDSVPSLFVLCFSYLFTCPALICFNAVSGTGNTRTAFVLEMSALVIYVMFCTVVIAWAKADVAVCWLAEIAYGLSMLVICGLYLWSNRWKGTRI
ncbi:MAG: MATE family efflux transporter [Bacteroidetes bacterium]|uniref:Multidrug-efflux transporter n=1 Tax=Candidatus Cryptobacteroides gallistercoris TaxID=2840765 RepID=A0A940DMM7_9BACT|nr:MATE family efflux transporter [Candidatus Cryptobacteroides gallistercoris]